MNNNAFRIFLFIVLSTAGLFPILLHSLNSKRHSDSLQYIYERADSYFTIAEDYYGGNTSTLQKLSRSPLHDETIQRYVLNLADSGRYDEAAFHLVLLWANALSIRCANAGPGPRMTAQEIQRIASSNTMRALSEKHKDTHDAICGILDAERAMLSAEKLKAFSNTYLFETNDAVKADVAWAVNSRLEGYHPAFLAEMGLPGDAEKYFVFVEVPLSSKYSYCGLDMIRATVFDQLESWKYTPICKREFPMGSRMHVDGIELRPPADGLGEVMAIHALYGGPDTPFVRATTFWTLVPDPPNVPLFRQLSEEGDDGSFLFRYYENPEDAARFNCDGLSPEDWARGVTNSQPSLRIRSLYELGCSYDFPNAGDNPRAVELKGRIGNARKELLQSGTLGNLSTNDSNPWVRIHAEELIYRIMENKWNK